MKKTLTKALVCVLMPLEYLAKRYALRKMQREWNRHNPIQMLGVFVALLKHNPELANEFRRALKMQDAPKDEPRIYMPDTHFPAPPRKPRRVQ